mgnify:CR=1 FL=1
MHKIFGDKCEVVYVDRKGAYIIPSHDSKLGVVQTQKGFFFLGGGIDENETDIACIQRECLEEAGCTAVVKEFICSAETYIEHPVIGHFHPIQNYYAGEIVRKEQEPMEGDHKLVWLSYEELKGNMFLEMQNWALDQYHDFERGVHNLMTQGESDNEVVELTADEIDEIEFEEQLASGEYDKEVPEYYFSNPDPYAKVEPRPDDAPKREFTFDEKGNIVVKNLSAFWLPDVKIVDEIGGTEYTVTGSYEGTETLDKKLHRIMEQNAADDELGITEDGE